MNTLLIFPMCATCLAQFRPPDLSTLITLDVEYKFPSPAQNFLHPSVISSFTGPNIFLSTAFLNTHNPFLIQGKNICGITADTIASIGPTGFIIQHLKKHHQLTSFMVVLVIKVPKAGIVAVLTDL